MKKLIHKIYRIVVIKNQPVKDITDGKMYYIVKHMLFGTIIKINYRPLLYVVKRKCTIS